MNKEKYLVTAQEGSLIQVDYIIDVCENKYTIMYSHDMHWRSDIRGKTIGSIVDTGDGYIFSQSFIKRDMDYSLFSELHVLLTFITKHDNLSYKFKFAKIEGGNNE